MSQRETVVYMRNPGLINPSMKLKQNSTVVHVRARTSGSRDRYCGLHLVFSCWTGSTKMKAVIYGLGLTPHPAFKVVAQFVRASYRRRCHTMLLGAANAGASGDWQQRGCFECKE